MQIIKNIAKGLGLWLLMVALVMLETGYVPSSRRGWAAWLLFGPVGYLLLAGVVELGLHRLGAATRQAQLGAAARVGLLVCICIPIFALVVYLNARHLGVLDRP